MGSEVNDEAPRPDSSTPTPPESVDPSRTPGISGTSRTPGQDALKRRFSWGAYLARGALVVLALVGLFVSSIPWGRAALRTLVLVPGLVAARPFAPLVASGEPIRHVSLTISSEAGPVYLDVWEPTTAPPPVPGARQGVLIIPGVGDNRTTPQLVNLTESLARTGVVVMTMTTNSLIDFELSPADAHATVRAFETLRHWPGVGATRVGIFGLSAGGAPATLAAADPRIRQQVAFLMFFGCFFNAHDLLPDVGRRALLVNGQREAWEPSRVPLYVLANTIAGTLPPAEAVELKAAFDSSHPTTLLTPEQVARLSAPAAAAYHILAGDQPNLVERNLDAFSKPMQRLLEALSPSSVVGQISAPVYLLHDRHDSLVPFTESVNFAAALSSLHHPHEYIEFSIFQHTTVSGSLDLRTVLRDSPRLFGAIQTALMPSA